MLIAGEDNKPRESRSSAEHSRSMSNTEWDGFCSAKGSAIGSRSHSTAPASPLVPTTSAASQSCFTRRSCSGAPKHTRCAPAPARICRSANGSITNASQNSAKAMCRSSRSPKPSRSKLAKVRAVNCNSKSSSGSHVPPRSLEALAKLKAANAAPDKNADTNGATASRHRRRRLRRRRKSPKRAERRKKAAEKPKTRGKKAQPEDAFVRHPRRSHSVRLRFDPWPLSSLERRSQPAEKFVGMLGSAFEAERLNALAMLQNMADDYKVPIHEFLLDSAGTVAGQVQVSIDSGPSKRSAKRAKLSFERSEPNKQPVTRNTSSCRT